MKEAGDAAKVKGEDALKKGQYTYDDVKVSHYPYNTLITSVNIMCLPEASAQSKLDSARSRADGTASEAADRARAAAHDAQAKLDSYKKSAGSSLHGARESANTSYNDAKAATERKVDDVESGWSSWFGWGKGKAEGAKSQGAEKVADAAGDVKKSAEKRV